MWLINVLLSGLVTWLINVPLSGPVTSLINVPSRGLVMSLMDVPLSGFITSLMNVPFCLQHYVFVGDCQIPLAIKMFIDEHGQELITKGLYKNYLLHISNLFEFGVLPPGYSLFLHCYRAERRWGQKIPPPPRPSLFSPWALLSSLLSMNKMPRLIQFLLLK